MTGRKFLSSPFTPYLHAYGGLENLRSFTPKYSKNGRMHFLVTYCAIRHKLRHEKRIISIPNRRGLQTLNVIHRPGYKHLEFHYHNCRGITKLIWHRDMHNTRENTMYCWDSLIVGKMESMSLCVLQVL